MSWLKPVIAMLTGATACALLILQVPYINGSPISGWPYRQLPAGPTYLVTGLALLPWLVALWDWQRRREPAFPLAVVMLASFLMRVASIAVYTDPPSLDMVRVIVENPDATSYYTAAAALGREMTVPEWLPAYHEYMRILPLHAQTKAPGPTLFYSAVIALLGYGSTAAMTGGLVVGALASLSIVATYWMLRVLLDESEPAFCGAIFLALCPGFVLFFPMFDPIYAVLSAALVGSWALALRRQSIRWAMATGAALAATCAVSFNLLAVGFFMAMLPLVAGEAPRQARFLTFLRQGALALASAAALLLLAYATTGYDVVSTFRAAWDNQRVLLARHAGQRLYPQSIAFDLTDFALGSGWISVALALMCLLADAKRRALVILCLAQFVVVAATGLLQSETARVWNFMLPLLMVPVGLELARWSLPARVSAYIMLWLVLATVSWNLKYIY